MSEFRPIPGFENYEIDRQGNLRRRHRGSRRNSKPVGAIIQGMQLWGTDKLNRGYMMGKYGPRKTARSLVALTFGSEAVPPWRYHIVTHPELKIHKGEANGNHVLTENEVREIRTRYASGGATHRGLAREFGIGRSTVNQILQNRTWKHLEQTQ